MLKLLSLIPIFNPKAIAGVLGIIQAAIKFIKEVITLIINLLFPIIPDGKFEEIVLKVRDIINKVDEAVGKIKDFFLKMGG